MMKDEAVDQFPFFTFFHVGHQHRLRLLQCALTQPPPGPWHGLGYSEVM